MVKGPKPTPRSIAKSLGIRLSRRQAKHATRAQYDGESVATGGQSAENVLHELAHYQVCSKRRRKLPNFGLGLGQDSMVPTPLVPRLSYSAANHEEALASALGICWELACGIDPGRSLNNHGWSCTRVELGKVLEELQGCGYLDNDGQPVLGALGARRRWGKLGTRFPLLLFCEGD